MEADRTRVINRVQEILNVVEPGTYGGALSVRNKTRNANAISDMVDAAGMMILRAIAERPNEFRYQFLTDSPTITVSGDPLPPHLGPLASVMITKALDDKPIEGHRLDWQRVESYRDNPSKVYDALDHDEAGSSLGGYYDVWEDRFHFSGLSAVVQYARVPETEDVDELIPEVLENTWVRLSIGEASKVGTGGFESAVIGEFGTKGMRDLEEFKAGGRVFKEVDIPKPTSAMHEVK